VRARSFILGAVSLAALSVLIARPNAPRPGQPILLRVSAQPARRNVARLGVNLGTWTSWGAEQLSSNVLMNPGFETTIDRALVIISEVDARGFEDDQSWLARPGDFWRGAHYDVRSGAGAGIEGVLVGSKPAGPHGMPFYEADPMPAHLAAGDVVAITRESEPGPAANWWVARSSAHRVSVENAEHRPGSPGHSALSLTLGTGAPAQVSSYLDAITDRAGKLLPVNGPWRLLFWSRVDGVMAPIGSAQAALRVSFGRVGSAPFLDRRIEPSGSWQMTSLDFDGQDEEAPCATLELRFSAAGTAGGRVLLDDVDLRAMNSAPTPFRAEVIAALRALHPGYLRDWQGQLADTLANRIAPAFARHPTRYRPGDQTQFGYSLPDFLDLCRRVDARPWIVVPATFSDSELVGLGKFLAAQNAARRFDEIALEFGNENWNAIFRPAAIPDPQTYGAVASRAFRLIREGAGAAPPLRMIVGGQYANPGLDARLAANAPAADTLAVAPYFLYSLAAAPPPEPLAALFEDSAAGLPAIARIVERFKKDLAVYEVNLHTIGGDAPDSERNSLIAGAASGTAIAWRIIESLNRGATIQCPYVLAGFDASTAARGGFARLWGVTRDLAGAPRLRPTGLAIAMLNQAFGGSFYPVSANSSKVSAAAFLNGTRWSAVVASAADKPMTVRIEFPGQRGAGLPARILRLESKSPFSTNEERPQVEIAQSLPTVVGNGVMVTLPPYGLAALTAAQPGGQQP